MERRSFVCLAAALAALPRAAVAQGGPARLPVIGYLVPANPKPVYALFREGLQQVGYAEGKNIRIELRSADGKAERLGELAADLVRLKVDILVTVQTPAGSAAQQATRDIPIVLAGAGDPVRTGLVASLARPGGNITGITGVTAEIAGKSLELIREALPGAKRLGVLANAHDPFTATFVEHLQIVSRQMAIELSIVTIRQTADLEGAFQDLARQKADVVIVQPSLQRRAAAELALKHRLPSFCPTSQFPGEGGLMSYSANQAEVQRVAAAYVARILKGAKPADLPVQQASMFDLAVNRKTASALGITIPISVLARADRIIE